MTQQTVFLFSGQGSQHFQMGRGLFEHERVFRESMLRLDALVRELSGRSVVETLYAPQNTKATPFDSTTLTHPAIFMVEYSLARCLIEAGVVPDITLGSSLGSFAAATIAGLIDVDDALAAVVRQARAFEESCRPGGMIAVLADPALGQEEFLRANAETAGVNFASHFVLSAPREQLACIEAHLRSREIPYQRLPVSFAYHSQWIDEARPAFESSTRPIRFQRGHAAYACSESAEFVENLSVEYFWHVVRRPIRFRDAIGRLERDASYRYIDVGPSSTLATFLKYALQPGSRSSVLPILSPYGQDSKNLAAAVAATRH